MDSCLDLTVSKKTQQQSESFFMLPINLEIFSDDLTDVLLHVILWDVLPLSDRIIPCPANPWIGLESSWLAMIRE